MATYALWHDFETDVNNEIIQFDQNLFVLRRRVSMVCNQMYYVKVTSSTDMVFYKRKGSLTPAEYNGGWFF